jgi:DNA-binding CsgD family transcriptional regulator
MVAVPRVVQGARCIEAEIAQVLALQATEIGSPMKRLTERDLEIIRFLRDGQSLSNIAAALRVSYNTVANTCRRIKAKLGVAQTADLVRLSIEKAMPWSVQCPELTRLRSFSRPLPSEYALLAPDRGSPAMARAWRLRWPKDRLILSIISIGCGAPNVENRALESSPIRRTSLRVIQPTQIVPFRTCPFYDTTFSFQPKALGGVRPVCSPSGPDGNYRGSGAI